MVAGAAHAHLPLHAKAVEILDYDKVLRLPDRSGDELGELLRWNTDASRYTSLVKGPRANPTSTVSDEDLQALLLSGVVEETTKASLKRMGTMFSVVEEEKGRRRPIYWPRQVNAEVREFRDAEGLQFLSPSLEDTLAAPTDLWKKDLWATAADLRVSFHQCVLAPEVRPYFGFRVSGRYFRMARMPMGEVVAPAIMNAITKRLAEAAAEGCDVRTRVYIDNVRFVGTRLATQTAMNNFRRLCRDCGVSLNDEAENVPHQDAVFLGVRHQYGTQLVSLAPKTFKKLQRFEEGLRDGNLLCSEFMSGFGVLEYASRVLRIRVSQFYHCMKFARRRARALMSGEMVPSQGVDIWPSISSQMRKWVAIALRNVPVPPLLERQGARQFVLATDASLFGWGAVLFNDLTGSYEEAGGRWGGKHESSEINQLEAHAVANAFEAFRGVLGAGANVLLLVDNTSVQHTLRKGKAAEYPLNAAIDRVLRTLDGNANVRVNYLHTSANPADAASRGAPTNKQLASTLGSVGRGLEPTSFKVSAPVIPNKGTIRR